MICPVIMKKIQGRGKAPELPNYATLFASGNLLVGGEREFLQHLEHAHCSVDLRVKRASSACW